MPPSQRPRDIHDKALLRSGRRRRTAQLAVLVGRRLELLPDDLQIVAFGAQLHDFGKIGIPDAILSKPGKLSRRELAVMQTHPMVGHRICKPMRPVPPLAQIIRNHHERLDGTGYPDGLAADRIPATTRVVSVTEVYDAMRSDRPYRPAMAHAQVCHILRAEAKRGWWDTEIVEITLDVAEKCAAPDRSVA